VFQHRASMVWIGLMVQYRRLQESRRCSARTDVLSRRCWVSSDYTICWLSRGCTYLHLIGGCPGVSYWPTHYPYGSHAAGSSLHTYSSHPRTGSCSGDIKYKYGFAWSWHDLDLIWSASIGSLVVRKGKIFGLCPFWTRFHLQYLILLGLVYKYLFQPSPYVILVHKIAIRNS